MIPLKISLQLALLILLSACFSEQDTAAAADRYHVILLHTNDVHGQAQTRPATWVDRENPPEVGGLPRLAALVRRIREEAEQLNAGFLLVDGGDWFQGTPEGLVGGGLPFVKAMQLLNYDAVTVGNHELDYGITPLRKMIAESGMPALAANLFQEEGGEHVDWCDPYRIVKVGDLRVGIVGLLTLSTPSITHRDASDIHFMSPADALTLAKQELAGKVDWILPITHLGVSADRRLAKAHPDLGVIVGGHSHTYLKEGVQQGDTLIVQSGSKASGLGRVDLWFDPVTWELVDCRARVLDLLEEPLPVHRNSEVDRMCGELVAQSEREMSVVVGILAQPFERNFKRTHSSSGGNLIVDRMRAAVEADVSFQNRGGIRCDLKKGEVTRRGLFELLPFGNHLVLLEMKGSTLMECLRASVEGTAHTGLEISGMTVLWSQEGEVYRLEGLEVAGEPLDSQRMYRVATNNFLAGGGDGYAILKEQKTLREDPRMMREIMEAHFQSTPEVQLPTDDRYRRVDP